MRRKISTLLMVSAAILSVILIPSVLAIKPTPAPIGYWQWKAPSTYFEPYKMANGNVFIRADDDAEFTGTFVGTGYDEFTMTQHPNGFFTGSGQTTFSGEVMGEAGTCIIKWDGNTKNDMGYWWFKWVIISGTDDLENLRGSGYCWGPGPADLNEWGGVDMYGKIHFDPS